MKLSLKVLTAGKGEGKVIPVAVSPFFIGRDPACQLRPASPIISKRHCSLHVQNGKILVRDLASTNGTFVNGTQIQGDLEIGDQDRLQIGPLEFLVVVEVPAPVKSPRAPAPRPVSARPKDEDEVAALLLEAPDETEAAPAEPVLSEGADPNSTTMIDLVPPPQAAEPSPGKPTVKVKTPAAPVKPPTGDTREAAKALLEKYMRRPRG